jgi:hypothetical protein
MMLNVVDGTGGINLKNFFHYYSTINEAMGNKENEPSTEIHEISLSDLSHLKVEVSKLRDHSLLGKVSEEVLAQLLSLLCVQMREIAGEDAEVFLMKHFLF